MNVDVHSDNEDKGYKNPHKPKARGYTTLIPKTIPKLKFFDNILQLNLILT